jgi:hypothetical protein
LQDLKSRIEPLHRFFRLIESVAVQLLSVPAADLAEFSRIARDDDPKP